MTDKKILLKNTYSWQKYGIRSFYRLLLKLKKVNRDAMRELTKAGYNKKNKQITPKQQEIIEKYLG